MDHSFIGYSFRLRRIKCFIKRSFSVRIEIVHHEADFLHMRIMLINKVLYKMRPINFCPLLSDFGVSLTN